MTTETHRTARGFVNRPGHWTMGQTYPFLCIYCGGDFDEHNATWPEMRCPDHLRLREAAPDLLAALIISRGQWIHSVNAEQCLAAIAKATGAK